MNEKRLMKTIESMEKEMEFVSNILNKFDRRKSFFTSRGYTDHAVALTKGLNGLNEYYDMLNVNVKAFRMELGFKKVPIRVERHLTLATVNGRRIKK